MPITIKAKKSANAVQTQIATTTTKAPLQTLALGDWLKGPIVQALREKYGKDREGGQRGANHLVSSGMVRIPTGHVLQAVAIRRFGGTLGFVCTVPGTAKTPAYAAIIEGLPD